MFTSADTLSGLGLTPCPATMRCPRSGTVSVPQTHFVILIEMLAPSIRLRTTAIWSKCSPNDELKIAMSSMYTTTMFHSRSRRTSCIWRWNVAGADTSPNGITHHSSSPYPHVANAVLYLSSSASGTPWKPAATSHTDIMAIFFAVSCHASGTPLAFVSSKVGSF